MMDRRTSGFVAFSGARVFSSVVNESLFSSLKVTKKRVANKKNLESKEAPSPHATPLQPGQTGPSDVTRVTARERPTAVPQSPQATTPTSAPQANAASHGQGQGAPQHRPAAGAASRRRARKLAVNFSACKPAS